jgi:hypothetical protein
MVEFVAEVADPCELFADAEVTALLPTCAPSLLTLAEVSPAAEEPTWLSLCCAEAAAEELFPACTPLDRLASSDVLLAADAPACVPDCDWAYALPAPKIPARTKKMTRFICSLL